MSHDAVGNGLTLSGASMAIVDAMRLAEALNVSLVISSQGSCIFPLNNNLAAGGLQPSTGAACLSPPKATAKS